MFSLSFISMKWWWLCGGLRWKRWWHSFCYPNDVCVNRHFLLKMYVLVDVSTDRPLLILTCKFAPHHLLFPIKLHTSPVIYFRPWGTKWVALVRWPWWDARENWWNTMLRSRWQKSHPNHNLDMICAYLLSIYPRPLWHFIVTSSALQMSRSVRAHRFGSTEQLFSWTKTD